MSSPSLTEVILLHPSQIERAYVILARAFFDYPSVQYFFPDPDQRRKALPWWIGLPVRYCLRHGLVYTTAAVEGVAAWLPPENAHFTWGRLAQAGLFQVPFRAGFAACRRMVDNDRVVDGLRLQLAPHMHWYLWSLAVDPACQRKGVGAALLAPVLQRADADGVACYLETHNRPNLDYYRQFGFEVVREAQVPGHPLTVWMMLRQPSLF